MIIIGERINGMFKDVARAIKDKDKKAIQDLAYKQMEAGATYLDVNVGPASADKIGAMEWLVKTIAEAVDAPLAIDAVKADVMEAGLKFHKKGIRPLINSTTAQAENLAVFLPLAKKYDALLIGLTMDDKGIPSLSENKSELALGIIAAAMEYDIPTDDIFIDPLTLPVNVAQDQCPKTLEAIKMFTMLSDPQPHIVIGLSNVSQKTLYRELINRTYLVMAMTCGVDAAILDPMDKELMDAVKTAEILLNKTIYCDSYLNKLKA